MMINGVLERHQLNPLLILLKIQNSEKITQFRPISLCIMLYKVATKVIVNRLTPLMGTLVKQNQASFIPSRCISDNIIIAQEVAHSMQNFKGRKMGMTQD